MFNIQDKQLRKELQRAGILMKNEVWEGSLTANNVVSRCDYLYDIVSALTKHLGIVLKQDPESKAFYFVKRKKGKAKAK